MKKYRVAFQMEPLTAVNPATNSSAHLLAEAQRRGFVVYHYEPQNLTLQDGAVLAKAARVEKNFKTGAYDWIDLAQMDIVLIRQDPPFNMAYTTSTFFLEQLPPKVRVLNNPFWVRNTGEKLVPLLFPEHIPPMLFTRDPEQIRAFLKKHGDAVIKPLYGHHGNGVFHLRPGGNNVSAIIEYALATSTEPWIVQPFLKKVKKGNLRVLFIDGEVVGQFMVLPEKNEFRLYRGSKNIPHTLTPAEKALCKKIGKVLKERGLYYVGIDIIGKYLIEINVTSTGSIDKFNALYGKKLEKLFWDKLV